MSPFKLFSLLLLSLFISGCTTLAVGPGQSDNLGNLKVINTDLLTQIALGNIEGASIIQKFGASELDTTIHPVTQSQIYMTPTTAINLEFVSDNINDNYNGAGAREITIIGLNSSWHEVEQTIMTNGTTPVQLSIPLTRLYRWFVSSSGTYATTSLGSHVGELTIRESGAGSVWTIIVTSPFPMSQSQIGVYTIPAGKIGYLISKNVFTDSRFTSDIYLYQRCNLNDTTSPYSGVMRLIEREVGVTGGFSLTFTGGKGPFIGPCDIGFMGSVETGTAETSVELELILLDYNSSMIN